MPRMEVPRSRRKPRIGGEPVRRDHPEEQVGFGLDPRVLQTIRRRRRRPPVFR